MRDEGRGGKKPCIWRGEGKSGVWLGNDKGRGERERMIGGGMGVSGVDGRVGAEGMRGKFVGGDVKEGRGAGWGGTVDVRR